ncbi:MAG: amino acid ABC transporter ATP-binding protein [Desulfobacter sp.]
MTQETSPILTAENITKRFGDQTILNNVSLAVNKGEIKVLIGPSGAGKSTFLQSLNFLVMPDTGTITLENREINPGDKRGLCDYRRQVGMIFQDFNLFDHLTALANVEIGMVRVLKMKKDPARERAMAELARVGLADQADKYPAQLSGGQKQRVSIARALAMDPKVMLLDEPTSALDPELIGEVQAVIRNLGSAGMTMIMATHQIGFARTLADEIIFMENGRVVEQGTPQALLAPGATTRTRDFCAKIAEIGGE